MMNGGLRELVSDNCTLSGNTARLQGSYLGAARDDGVMFRCRLYSLLSDLEEIIPMCLNMSSNIYFVTRKPLCDVLNDQIKKVTRSLIIALFKVDDFPTL